MSGVRPGGTLDRHRRGLDLGLVGALFDDDKADAARVAIAGEPQAGRRVRVRRDDDVLQRFAQGRFDRALVAAIDFEVVGNRSHLADVLGRLGEDGASAVSVLCASGVELLERCQARDERGEIVLTGAQLGRARVAIRACPEELRLARGAVDPQGLHGRARALERVGGRGALAGGTTGVDAEVVVLDVEGGNLLGHPRPRGHGMLHGVPQRRRGVDRGEHLAPGGLDIGLEPFNLALGGDVRRLFGRQRGCRFVAFGAGAARGLTPGVELQARGFLARVERHDLRLDFGGRDRQLCNLLAVEGNLLLEAADLHLARVRGLPRRRGLTVGLHQLEAQPLERRLELGEPGRGRGLALARAGELRARGLDRFAKHAVALGELHLLPPPQLFAQPLVATRLGRLSLQRAALLLDFEDDVVDAREVLLRGFELELRRAPAALVLRHARGLFDELAAIGRTRAQNLADLALLDHRVRLDADAGVHQQVLHVAQPAHLAVDQVLAFARSIEPPHHFNVAHEERFLLGERLDDFGDHVGRHRHTAAVGIAGRAAVHEPEFDGRMAIAACRERAAGNGPRGACRAGWNACRHTAELESNLSRSRRLARVAPAEDQVLHAVAAQAAGTLLTEHPRQSVDDVALAAAVGANNRRHPLLEGQLRAVGKALETRDFETLEPHENLVLKERPANEKAAHGRETHSDPEAAGSASIVE